MKFVKLFSSFIFVENKAKKLSIAVAIVHFFNAVIREKKDSKNLTKLCLQCTMYLRFNLV